MTPRSVGAYIGLATLNAMLVALVAQIAAGAVPVPTGLVWIVPIAVAGLTQLSMFLPQVAVRPTPLLPLPEPETPKPARRPRAPRPRRGSARAARSGRAAGRRSRSR